MQIMYKISFITSKNTIYFRHQALDSSVLSLLCYYTYLELHNNIFHDCTNHWLDKKKMSSPNRSVAPLALCCDLVGMAEQCGLCYPDPEESLTLNNSLLIYSIAKNHFDE